MNTKSRGAKILSLCIGDNQEASRSGCDHSKVLGKSLQPSTSIDYIQLKNKKPVGEMDLEIMEPIFPEEVNERPLEAVYNVLFPLRPPLRSSDLILSKGDPLMINVNCEQNLDGHLLSKPLLKIHNTPFKIDSNNLSDFEDYQESESSYRPSEDGSSSESDVKTKKNRKEIELKNINEKDTTEKSNKKRKRAKKGQANKELWTRQKNKILREKGKNYVSQTKLSMNERTLGQRCDSKVCAKSKLRSCHLLKDEDRHKLFSYFWNDLDWNSRKAYIKNLVSCTSVNQKTVKESKSRRKNTLKYSVKVDDAFLPVCKKTFLSTFNIKEWSVRSWVLSKKMSQDEVDISGNKKGSAEEPIGTEGKKRKIASVKTDSARSFLLQLPKMPSHYARKSSTKLYLEPLYQSFADVYRVYQSYCNENNIKLILGKGNFTLLIQDMNIGLFQPKKDQCDLCVSQNLRNEIPLETYQKHIAQKDQARAEKAQDKERAISGEFTLLTADAQSLQLVPFTHASSIYFKQKLVCRNYTICNLANKKVVCYVWDECNGGSEANNFTTCLLDFLDTELTDQERKQVIIFTDGCNAQNRNTVLANALQYYVNTRNVEITQKYLIRGHTQMECDSVHATIERRKKNRDLYAPANFVELIKQSRVGPPGPYNVKYVDYSFFKDYSAISYYNAIRPGKKAGDPVVNDIRALRYSAESDLQYKIDFNADWQVLPQRKNKSIDLPKPLYTAQLPIKKSKYDNLQSLKPIILKDYHAFYDALPYVNN